MAYSLRAGIEALAEDTDAALILLADMPAIAAAHIDILTSAFAPDRICRATTPDGRPGHPVLFPRRFFADLAALTGDHGARGIIAANPGSLTSVPLPASAAITDIDTPADLAAWRARGSAP